MLPMDNYDLYTFNISKDNLGYKGDKRAHQNRCIFCYSIWKCILYRFYWEEWRVYVCIDRSFKDKSIIWFSDHKRMQFWKEKHWETEWSQITLYTWLLVNTTKRIKKTHFVVHVYPINFYIFQNYNPMIPSSLSKSTVLYFSYVDYWMINMPHSFWSFFVLVRTQKNIVEGRREGTSCMVALLTIDCWTGFK